MEICKSHSNLLDIDLHAYRTHGDILDCTAPGSKHIYALASPDNFKSESIFKTHMMVAQHKRMEKITPISLAYCNILFNSCTEGTMGSDRTGETFSNFDINASISTRIRRNVTISETKDR